MPQTPMAAVQSKPAADTLTTLYTCPAATQVVVSSWVVCNGDDFPRTFRIAVSPGGAAIDPKHYVYYDCPVPAHDTFVATIGATLAAGDVVRVYAAAGGMAFHQFGVAVT